MATYKVLAQSAPSATTNTTLYTASNATIVSTLNVANTGGAADTIRIAVRPAAARRRFREFDAERDFPDP